MKKKQFYIDVDTAAKRLINHRVSVSLNGKKVKRVIAAKSGVNGFVEYFEQHPKIIHGESIEFKKMRGNVKISIAKEYPIKEGAPCPDGCIGQKLQNREPDGCTCHLFAPCFNCESSILECVECGYEHIE